VSGTVTVNTNGLLNVDGGALAVQTVRVNAGGVLRLTDGAVTTDLRIDDVIAKRSHGRLIKPHGLRPTRRKVDKEDVTGPHKSLDRRARRVIAQVDRHAFLTAVHPDETAREALCGRVPAAGDISVSRALDLDHFGAQVAEHPRAHRPGQPDLAGENTYSGEQAHEQYATGENRLKEIPWQR
jgi:hypothetical protein